MKRLLHALFFLFCALAIGVGLYYLIRERSGAAASKRPVATRQVVVSSGNASQEEREAKAERDAAVNRIAALPNEVILDVAVLNLDEDEGDEQVLTVRKTDRADGRLSIVAADYVPLRRTWVRSWEGETLATKPTTFSVQVKDVLGDHGLALVCTGMDESNEQTISIFRRSPGDPALVYEPICSVAADSVAIDEIERSEGYQLGQTEGESWPVLSYSRDKESQNLLDQVKTVYRWDPRKKSFVVAAMERIPGAQVERAMIAKVLTGSEKDFEGFLQGVWYGSGSGPFDPGAKLLVFDRLGSKITFYSSEAQEVFTWNESNPTRYGLYVSCQNESVSNLRRLMNIELTGSEAISIRVFEDIQMKVDVEDRWDGSYRKLPSDGSATVARAATGHPEPSFKLEGPYRAADGAEIVFARPRYSLRSGDSLERGSFNAYKLGNDVVLELSVFQENGLRSSRKTYRATYTEQKNGRNLVRRLVLAPAKAAISGLELLEEPSLVFEQKVGG
jgi:hypothetical protein